MTQSANNVHAVWNVTIQSSSGITSTNYERHNDQSSIQKSKQIILDNVGLKFNIPQLPFLKDTVVKLSLKDQSRGVTDHYIYLSGEDLNVPCAAVVITEIPKDMQNLNDSLNAAVEMQEDMAQRAGIAIEFFQIESKKFGSALDIFIPNRKGTAMFPTSNYTIRQDQDKFTVGISRFAFFNNKLIEWSLIIPISPETNQELIFQNCVDIMDNFWSNLELI